MIAVVQNVFHALMTPQESKDTQTISVLGVENMQDVALSGTDTQAFNSFEAVEQKIQPPVSIRKVCFAVH